MTDAKLRPCPFCGESNAVICTTPSAWNGGPAHAVSCRTADCHGAIWALAHDLYPTKAAAIAAWNKRKEPT